MEEEKKKQALTVAHITAEGQDGTLLLFTSFNISCQVNRRVFSRHSLARGELISIFCQPCLAIIATVAAVNVIN